MIDKSAEENDQTLDKKGLSSYKDDMSFESKTSLFQVLQEPTQNSPKNHHRLRLSSNHINPKNYQHKNVTVSSSLPVTKLPPILSTLQNQDKPSSPFFQDSEKSTIDSERSNTPIGSLNSNGYTDSSQSSGISQAPPLSKLSQNQIKFKPVDTAKIIKEQNREIHQNNGLQTVFLPFARQAYLMQPSAPPPLPTAKPNINSAYLPPPLSYPNQPMPVSAPVASHLSQMPKQDPAQGYRSPQQSQGMNPRNSQSPPLINQANPHSNSSTPFSHEAHQFKLEDGKITSKKIPDELIFKFKPYQCTFPSCKWSFARQSDLRRHAKSHVAPLYHCPYWEKDQTCHRNGGAFSRLDVLKRHLRLVHYIRDKQVGKNGVEDSGWCKTCQRMFPNSKVFIEHCSECALQLGPSKWSQVRQTPNMGQEQPPLPSNPMTSQSQDNELSYLNEPSEILDPNSNLITLSSVINEFESRPGK